MRVPGALRFLEPVALAGVLSPDHALLFPGRLECALFPEMCDSQIPWILIPFLPHCIVQGLRLDLVDHDTRGPPTSPFALPCRCYPIFTSPSNKTCATNKVTNLTMYWNVSWWMCLPRYLVALCFGFHLVFDHVVSLTIIPVLRLSHCSGNGETED